ncbi:MAG: hypothetical protein M0R39_01080 [Prolixibacteraceae bacterium]|nr:hypothetical protein [Prolixibacteraceae bacterium]
MQDTIINGQRFLTFCGYSWLVENSAEIAEGPGPNYFSDSKENVWFDQNSKLHLKITYRNNKWYCAKITMIESLSYGRFIFYIDNRIDNFDKNVVAGLFSYKTDLQEIDIEFSKWGIVGNKNAQYSIQPANLAGNKNAFNINTIGLQSTHWFNWQKTSIDFASIQGHSSFLPTAGNIIQQWHYNGSDIPIDSNETVKINLWLYQGTPPSNLLETEITISRFEYVP